MTGDLTFTPRAGLSRRIGGFLGLLFPSGLILLAFDNGFLSQSGEDIATAFLATILFLLAAPTTWVFAFEFIEASRWTVVIVGAATSLPLWYLLGSRLSITAETWVNWIWRYLSFCGLWVVTIFILLFVLVRIVG